MGWMGWDRCLQMDKIFVDVDRWIDHFKKSSEFSLMYYPSIYPSIHLYIYTSGQLAKFLWIEQTTSSISLRRNPEVGSLALPLDQAITIFRDGCQQASGDWMKRCTKCYQMLPEQLVNGCKAPKYGEIVCSIAGKWMFILETMV